jgi:pimeloyl-ACP methyl ester carboxylesterase
VCDGKMQYCYSGIIFALVACATAQLPDANLNVSARIRYWGYKSVQDYVVTTADGYMLTVQRIQSPRFQPFQPNISRPVAFLQHGLEASSGCWITNLPGQSLAYVLADAGYDVWLGNSRGNSYGVQHVNMSSKNPKFWDFSWQEMAEFDITATVEYILQTTKQPKLYYIGHSQGTLVAFAKFSSDPYWAQQKIAKYIAIAPVATVGNIESQLKRIAPYTMEIKAALNLVGDYSLGDITWILKYITPLCSNDTGLLGACENLYFMFMGTEQKAHLNMTRFPMMIEHSPEGTSIKNIAHFGQMVNSGRFEKYDYGAIMNWKHYNQATPPKYDLTQLTVPTVLYYSTEDKLADEKDIITNMIPYLKSVIVEKYTTYSHCDFIWSLMATKDVYQSIIAHMQ